MIKICVIGLGYVGLPISMQISKRFETIGFEVNTKRIKELIKYKDTNNEFTRREFKNKKLIFTSQISESLSHTVIAFRFIKTFCLRLIS